MKIIIPVAIEVDPNKWAAEYGLSGPAEAEENFRESMRYAAGTNWAPQAIVQAWPVLRDLATITAGDFYAADDPAAAVAALIDAVGLDAVARVVRHREQLAADDAVARVVRAAVARTDYGPDAVPVAVAFDTMTYENGDFIYEGTATVFFSNGEDDSIDFDGKDANVLNDALNSDGSCAANSRVLVNVGTGDVERYEPHEHDVMASDLESWIKRANALA